MQQKYTMHQFVYVQRDIYRCTNVCLIQSIEVEVNKTCFSDIYIYGDTHVYVYTCKQVLLYTYSFVPLTMNTQKIIYPIYNMEYIYIYIYN